MSRIVPIFDTNVIADFQRGLIPHGEWARLLRCKGNNKWYLSQVTALELLAGIDLVPDFSKIKRQVSIAYNLCDGRVLNDPRLLICQEVLGIPFPPEQLPPASKTVRHYLDLVRRSATKDQLLGCTVPFRGRHAGIRDSSILSSLMADPKNSWKESVENFADAIYPGWRECFEKTGSRLPADIRKHVGAMSWDTQRATFVEGLLKWLGAEANQRNISLMSEKLSAVLAFTIFVTREFLLGKYSLEKHKSDIFDQFQLQYLALDRFIIVSNDPDLLKRTETSSQSQRIVTFKQFLSAF